MRVYGYVRVSSVEQNEARQIEAIKEYSEKEGLNLDDRNIIIDKQTGRNFQRPGYQTLKNQLLREGDLLIIKELDRLGRDMEGIKKEWQDLQALGIEIVILENELLNTRGKGDLEKTLIGNIVFEVLSYVAEKENEKRAKRQAEGIAIAKAEGRHLGRPRIDWDTISEKQRDIIRENYPRWRGEKQEITAVYFMELVNLKTNTFYKIIREYEELKESGKE